MLIATQWDNTQLFFFNLMAPIFDPAIGKNYFLKGTSKFINAASFFI